MNPTFKGGRKERTRYKSKVDESNGGYHYYQCEQEIASVSPFPVLLFLYTFPSVLFRSSLAFKGFSPSTSFADGGYVGRQSGEDDQSPPFPPPLVGESLSGCSPSHSPPLTPSPSSHPSLSTPSTPTTPPIAYRFPHPLTTLSLSPRPSLPIPRKSPKHLLPHRRKSVPPTVSGALTFPG